MNLDRVRRSSWGGRRNHKAVLYRLLAACLLVLLLGSLSVSALRPLHAAGETEYTLRLTELGLPPRIRLSGALAEYTFSVPVHPGLQPVALEAQIRVAPGITTGVLSVDQQQATLFTLALPPKAERLVVPLTMSEVQQHRLTLTIRTVLNPGEPLCAAALLRWVELSALRVSFRGVLRPPDTVAEFWPPDLQALQLYVPPTPHPGTINATLDLATFAARLALGHGVTVTVKPLAASAPLPTVSPAPFQRAVVVREGAGKGVRLVTPREQAWPLLVVSAPPEELAAVVRELVERWHPLLLARTVQLQAATTSVAPPLRRWTLADLGYTRLQMQGAGQLETSLSFSQADLGGPIAAATLRLAGTYSPVPSGGTATLAVLLNNGLVHALPLGQAGRFDFLTTLPAGLLRRDNTLTVRVLYTPPGGDCRVGVHDLIVRLDPASYLEVKRGQKLPPGFERFPQALLPTFEVSFDKLTPTTLQSAVQLVTALQRLTHTPLHPRVVPWEQALRDRQPLLAVALDPARAEALNPPLEPKPFRLLDSEGNELLRLGIETRFVILEAFTAGGRDVLLLTHRDLPEGLVTLTQELQKGDGWYALNGDVWLLPATGLPVAMRLRGSGLRIEPLPPSPLTWWQRIRPFVYAAAFAAVVVFLFWAYPRLVRERPQVELEDRGSNGRKGQGA